MEPKTKFFAVCHAIRQLVFFLSQSRTLRTTVLHPSSHFSTARHGSVNLIFTSNPLKWRFHFGAAKRQKFVSGVIIQKSGQIYPTHTAWVKFALFLCVFIGIMHEMWKRRTRSARGRCSFSLLCFSCFSIPSCSAAAVARWMRSGASAEGLLLFLYEVSW